MSGRKNELQAQTNELEPKAILCALQCTHVCWDRNYIEMMQFVRDSPKRLIEFGEADGTETSLTPYCPTKWTMRISSLRSIKKNYEGLINYFESYTDNNSGSVATVNGFKQTLQSFDFIFFLNTTTYIFERIGTLNTYGDPKPEIINIGGFGENNCRH